MEFDEETLQAILIEHTITGQQLKLIVSRDGLHLASHGLKEEEEDTFSAMCATMFGAGETAFYATDRDTPAHIEIVSKGSCLYLMSAGEHSLVAVMVASATPQKSVLPTLTKISTEVLKIVTS